ncbi:hypothetical protein [Solwaraspora sp. WMMD792]|uniref:hypothetical protein n=1 Tax=Solwaraspora sp. WMMD792 TaxID=3016099 RepID=UPI002415A003|nr:hypothetical protein [Solwaraspora sp. WMMD792]MDG4771988.1 hypothetical protein [Solwaraspora sp. WMMD792]
MPELIAPTIELYASWLDARDEWGRGTHQDGSGLRPSDDVDTTGALGATLPSPPATHGTGPR